MLNSRQGIMATKSGISSAFSSHALEGCWRITTALRLRLPSRGRKACIYHLSTGTCNDM